jgi:transposase
LQPRVRPGGRGNRAPFHARAILPTEEQALLEFFAAMRGSIHVTFEEGTQAQWLHDLLSPRVHRVLVCDRRGEKRQGNKGDKVDADQLSDRLHKGDLRAVYHGSGHRAALKELARTYENAVEDTTRTMLRLQALFRARAIRTPGQEVYQPDTRGEWLDRLPERAARFRAEALSRQLDVLKPIRQQAIVEARKDPAWERLLSIPFLGPVRVALLLATLQTPWRFRTKRNLWAYAGLAVVTHSSSDYAFQEGRVVRRRRAPLTRGLNQNHNRAIKNIFKERRDGRGRASRAAPGLLPRHAGAGDEAGARPRDAGAQAGGADAADLEDRRALRGEQAERAGRTTLGAEEGRCGSASPPTAAPRGPGHVGARESLELITRPAAVSRGTRLTPGPLAGPEEASGRPLPSLG